MWKSGKLLISCSGKMSHKVFQCHLATAAVCVILTHFSSLTQLTSPFSLTAKMSGRVCFPCCQSLHCGGELALKPLANWGFILITFEVCRWKFPCSLAYRFTLYWKIQSGIHWNKTLPGWADRLVSPRRENRNPNCAKRKKTWKSEGERD